jgi:hypothetical protein
MLLYSNYEHPAAVAGLKEAPACFARLLVDAVAAAAAVPCAVAGGACAGVLTDSDLLTA